MQEMKTLNGFEIVDEKARQIIKKIEGETIQNSTRITNIEQGALGIQFTTSGSNRSSFKQKTVPDNALPCAEMVIVGGGAGVIRSCIKNFLRGFSLNKSHFVRDWTEDFGLEIAGSCYHYASCELSGKVPAGTYKFTCTPRTAIPSDNPDYYFNVNLYTETDPDSSGLACLLSSQIALDSDGCFTVSEETNIYVGMESGSMSIETVLDITLEDVNGSGIVVDTYEVPEAITSMDAWQSIYNYLDLENGILYYDRASINEAGTPMDVRDIVGYDHYIKVMPGGYVEGVSLLGKSMLGAITFATK